MFKFKAPSVNHVVQHAGGVASSAAHHAGGVVAHAVQHAGGVASHAVHHAGGVIAQGAHHAGAVASEAIKKELTGKVIAEVQKALGLRHLSPIETSVARGVFGSTVPYDNVLLSPLVGSGGRPITVPGSFLFGAAAVFAEVASLVGLGPLVTTIPIAVLITELAGDLWDKYIIFFSKPGHANGILPRDFNHPYQTLMHELTHVWQGEHANVKYAPAHWRYVLQSCCLQTAHDVFGARDPYIIGSGVDQKKWDSFNPEAQAMIVQEWFADGSPQSDRAIKYGEGNKAADLYRFIKNNIRTGNNGA